jgi:hypothetical protein
MNMVDVFFSMRMNIEFLNLLKYRIFKPVEITRGKGTKEKNRGDEPIYINVTMKLPV